jgi:integrase
VTNTTHRVDDYVHAATRANTRRSYQAAIAHFEVEWGGFLPASADSVARYLAAYASTLALNTLRQRLAALAQWHLDQGFPDPTKAPLVKKTLKGIQALHPEPVKRARPLQLDELSQLVAALDQRIALAHTAVGHTEAVRATRDKALVLIGFWRGFRSDELGRLQVEHVVVHPDEGMTLFLPHTKTHNSGHGVTFNTPVLSRLCPVEAYQQWIALSGLRAGPVFRRIDRWGKISNEPLHPNSFIPLLRDLLRSAGIADTERFSSHSLRRGFATWANANGWDVKALMEYVGWRDVASALKYIEGSDPFARQRIEMALSNAVLPHGDGRSDPVRRLPVPAPNVVTKAPIATTLDLHFTLERHNAEVRGESKARRALETCCLKNAGMHIVDATAGRYRIVIDHTDANELHERVELLIDELYHLAATHSYFIKTTVTDPQTQRCWS